MSEQHAKQVSLIRDLAGTIRHVATHLAWRDALSAIPSFVVAVIFLRVAIECAQDKIAASMAWWPLYEFASIVVMTLLVSSWAPNPYRGPVIAKLICVPLAVIGAAAIAHKYHNESLLTSLGLLGGFALSKALYLWIGKPRGKEIAVGCASGCLGFVLLIVMGFVYTSFSVQDQKTQGVRITVWMGAAYWAILGLSQIVWNPLFDMVEEREAAKNSGAPVRS